jgi:benzoate-CoA ligase family protein
MGLTEQSRLSACHSGRLPETSLEHNKDCHMCNGVNAGSWFVDRLAELNADRIAILGGAVPVHYGELLEMTNRLGNVLLSMGCGPGDRVVIALPDSSEFVAAFFGAAKIAAVAVPISPYCNPANFAYYLADCKPKVVIIDGSLASHLSAVLAGAPVQVIVVGSGGPLHGAVNWSDCMKASGRDLRPLSPGELDPLCLLYTSGSTGEPKAAVHHHGAMLAAASSFAHHVLGIHIDDRMFSVSKLFFAYGLGNGMYFPMSVGASTVLDCRRTAVHRVASLILEYRPSILFGVPTFFAALLAAAEDGLTVDLGSVRLVVSAGEALPLILFERFKRRFNIEIVEGLGSTEMFQTFVSNRPGQIFAGTCGREVPHYEVKLIGENGEPVSALEVGTMWVKGPSSFSCYWNRPELTAGTKRGDWIITHDKFYRDEHGNLCFCGRDDDMFKVSGMWVIPSQLEITLKEHPAIANAVVVGRPNRFGTRRLVAYIVAKGAIDFRELRRLISERCAAHMVPKAFVTLQELPLTGSGKIDRRALPEPIEDSVC